MREGRLGEGGSNRDGGGALAVRQLFPISTQSTAASRSWPRRATASECSSEQCRGQKYLQLEGHPNLFGHIRADSPPSLHSPAVSALHALALCANLWPRARCSHHHLGAIMPFPHCFPSFRCSSAMFCSYPLSAWGSALLACYPRPPSTCNLRLAVLKSSHSSTGAYISTCSSPLQEQKFALNGLFSFSTCSPSLHVRVLLSTPPSFRFSRHSPGLPILSVPQALIYKCKPQTRGSCLWPREITPLCWAPWNGCKVCFVFSSALVFAQTSHWCGDDKLLW